MRAPFAIFFSVAALTAAGCGISGSGSAGSAGGSSTLPVTPLSVDLANPPEIKSSAGVANVTFSAALNPATGGPGIEYAGAFVPPTVRAEPGDTIRFNYANDLPPSSAEPLNMTSLHFHGLSISPNAPADDSIGLMAMPGQTLHYVIHVPVSQPPGLYWYHSHSHGEADWQLSNGMSGALIVEGTAKLSPATAGLPERVIVLRNVLSAPKFSSLAEIRSGAAHTFATATATAEPTAAPAICQNPFDVPSEHTTVNAANAGTTILMQPGQKQFWRILNASSNGFYDLHLDGSEFHVVSIDGVPLRTYPGAIEQDRSDLEIPPAGRIEAIVTGSAGGSLHTSCTDTGPGGDPNPPQVLALIKTGVPALPVVPAAGPTPRAHGTYDLAIGAPSAERSLAFSESSDGETFYLNGQVYSPTAGPMFTVRSGTVERWTLTNSSDELHVFHIHQLHFVTQDVDGVAKPAYWADTVTLPYRHADGTPSVTHVLLDFRDPIIRGTFLFHCHLLEHEDGGMMAKIAVQ
jgi:suppressor of ftsI